MARNVSVGIARMLPAALLSAMFVLAFCLLAGPLCVLVFAAWVGCGFVAAGSWGERVGLAWPLKYQPDQSGRVAAAAAARLPGRPMVGYLAPEVRAGFSVGRYSVIVHPSALGDPQLLAAQVDQAVADLRSRRALVDLPMFWWAMPWVLFKTFLVGLAQGMLGPRFVTVARFLFCVQVVVAIGQSATQGRAWLVPGLVVLLADQVSSFLIRRSIRNGGRPGQRRRLPQPVTYVPTSPAGLPPGTR